MRRALRRMLTAALCLILCLLLNGCRDRREEALRESAQRYVYGKYGEGFQPEHGEPLRRHPQRGIPRRTNDYLFTFSDGGQDFRVWYDAEEDRFLDDRQAEAINTAIRTQLLVPLRERLEPCEWEIENCCFGVTDELRLGLEGSFFHAYFDGDAAAFCREELPSPDSIGMGAVLFTTEGGRAEYEARLGVYQETAEAYFSLPIYYAAVGVERSGRRSFSISAAVYRSEDYPPRYAGTDFLAELIMDEQGARLYTPSWIEVTDGLYFTATSENCEIELQPGDIRFEPVYTAEELKALLKTIPAQDGKYWSTVPSTPAYAPVFSPRLRSLLAEADGKLRVDFRDERGSETQRLRTIDIDTEKNSCYIWFIVKGAVVYVSENPWGADGNLISYYFWDQKGAAQ